jgi:hypothetical protein
MWTITAEAVVGGMLWISRTILDAVHGHRDRAQSVRGAKRALSIDKSQLSATAYRHRSLHPLYSGPTSFHPDNLASLVSVLRDDVRRARRQGTLRVQENVEAKITQSLLLVGGPVSEGVSRLVFGYDDQDRPGGSTCSGLGRELPYRFDIDEGIVGQSARLVKDQGRWIVEREPNWGVIAPDGRRHYPMIGHDDFLRTDYLLLTKLPNFLVDATFGSGNSIVNVAGAHGIGTRGIELLLSRRNVLRKTAERLGIDPELAATWPEAYQALFWVGDIRHHKRRGSVASDIVLVDAARIDESIEWWIGWRDRVRAPLNNWFATGGSDRPQTSGS